MVFIKPKIMIDSNDSQNITSEKYNYIKAEQIISGKNNILDELD